MRCIIQKPLRHGFYLAVYLIAIVSLVTQYTYVVADTFDCCDQQYRICRSEAINSFYECIALTQDVLLCIDLLEAGYAECFTELQECDQLVWEAEERRRWDENENAVYIYSPDPAFGGCILD